VADAAHCILCVPCCCLCGWNAGPDRTVVIMACQRSAHVRARYTSQRGACVDAQILRHKQHFSNPLCLQAARALLCAAVTGATLTNTSNAVKPPTTTLLREADMLNLRNLQEMTPLALALDAGNGLLAVEMIRYGRYGHCTSCALHVSCGFGSQPFLLHMIRCAGLMDGFCARRAGSHPLGGQRGTGGCGGAAA
jgi:hypothetical protein